MEETLVIKKIAVLGAGVMGAQIAAHCVNAGFETYLFDLPSKEGPKNTVVIKAIQHLMKLNPAPLATPDLSSRLIPKNYEEDLTVLTQCDFIVEAIAEQLDLKINLFNTISPYLRPDTIVVTNSSGLSINTLSQSLPAVNRERFCGVHFFNPPRYMYLAELIPATSTSSLLLDQLETWLTRFLGKGIVRAKDTPNFIANRIGVFSLLTTLHYADHFGLSLDEVDRLTGTLLGRPKSATYRTMDVVGLDTMHHVVKTMQETLQDDPWHAFFKLPSWIESLIQAGHLGQKSGIGLYRKNGKNIEVYDTQLKNYRAMNPKMDEEINQIFKIPDMNKRMERLFQSHHIAAQFLKACFINVFHYSAFHLESIAHTVQDVDEAMRWGFGWEEGPFQSWQIFGVKWIKQQIEAAIQSNLTLTQMPLPHWVSTVDVFYKGEQSYAPSIQNYQEKRALPVYQRQLLLNHHSVLFENEGVKITGLSDDIAVLSFKSKANIINESVLDGLQEGIRLAESTCQGLIIYQQNANYFSAGADLRMIASMIQAKEMSRLKDTLVSFQHILLNIKYSPIPIVAALRGKALGGGCELLLHCQRIIAAFEAYPGLVEIGAGLIPAGGGCKEWALRAANASHYPEHFRLIHQYFEQTATAKVAMSATDALQKGFLKSSDPILMNSNEVLYGAAAQIKAMQALNHKPQPPVLFKVIGREGHAVLQAELVNALEGGFISAHDYYIAERLASVMCGGDMYAGTLVDEHWILNLEIEAFLELAENSLTQERMRYLLETGKPLRN